MHACFPIRLAVAVRFSVVLLALAGIGVAGTGDNSVTGGDSSHRTGLSESGSKALTAGASKAFPTVGILPKQEIGALRFLEQHAEFDGRGVVVAVFDTGVDPGAAGLSETTDGKPKILDMIDGTGSGDVDTSTVVSAMNYEVEGLTGRTLRLSSDWPNPSGEYHVGLKSAYSFFPDSLVSRLKRERRKRWDALQHKTEDALRRQIADWDRTHAEPDSESIEPDSVSPGVIPDSQSPGVIPDSQSPALHEEKPMRADLRVRLEQLKLAQKQYDDPGPVYDCVVFHDGKAWRAIVDTDEDGDLAEEKLLTNFRAQREFATFDDDSLLNFAVNIFDEGNRLSIVAESGAHGTHVAGIVAGHFPGRPELNGIAPGAQIVSVKIGDSRLGSMETGAGLVRGLRAVVENGCDLINMSYGEPTSTPDRGRLIELFSHLVNERGVIFVSSAGNAGPALSTVGAPGGTTSAVLGVGAYVSPAMMAAEYTLRQRLPEMPYTWTSRGPTFDGDLGVDIFAPGGAIAPVPGWTLQGSMRMNGTSMASPSACGAIALLLSGLKANETPYSPHSVRRALQNTARKIDAADVFAQGPGLVQVDRAFEHLSAHANAAGEQLRFAVSLRDRGGARGLCLREPGDVGQPVETSVRVRPVFPESADNRSKVGFELRITLEASADWVDTGDFVLLTHGGATFQVRVDPTSLPPGAHFAEVCGYDADARDRGPLFRLPITVLRPAATALDGRMLCAGLPTPHLSRPQVSGAARRPAIGRASRSGDRDTTCRIAFTPGQIERFFFHVPAGATWAELKLRSHAPRGESRTFVVHTVQAVPGQTFEANERRQFVGLRGGEEKVERIPIIGGRTLELCLAQYWSSLGTSELEYALTFRGILPDDRAVTLSAAKPAVNVEAAALLGRERLSPSATLTTHRTMIRPTSSLIRPLDSARDRLPDGRRLYALELSYDFTQERPGTVTPRFPANDDLLYDSPFGTQLWSIFDEGKRRVVTDDVYPESVKLGKGAHVLRLQVRHEDVAKLDRLKSAPLLLDRPLPKSIAVGVFGSRAAAVSGGRRFSSRLLERGEQASLWLAAPSSLPKGAKGGDLLLGTITYAAAGDGDGNGGRRPGGFPITYVLPAQPGADGAATSPKQPASVLDYRVARLESLITDPDDERFNRLAEEILKERTNHLPVLVAKLHRLDQLHNRKQHLEAVVAAADTVIEQVGVAELAAHYGTNVNTDDAQAVRARKEMDRRKERLVDALYRKGRALGYMELPDVVAVHPVADPEALDKAFEANFAELARWVDTTDRNYVLLHVRRERRRGRYGNALKLLNKYIPDSPPTYWYIKKRRDVYEKLGWKHCWEQEQRRLLISFPKQYEPF